MTEISSRDGSWAFDGEVIRIVPGHDRSVHKLRKALGELVVPLRAVAGIAFGPGRKGGRLRLRLRDGADPLSQAAAGGLTDSADPYRLVVGNDRTGVAEFFAEDVRNHMVVWEVPEGPCDRYLLPGPGIPLTASAGDGTASFDGERIRLEWNLFASDSKKKAGPQQLELAELAGVDWSPQSGMGYGHLRFRVKQGHANVASEEDLHALAWGMQREGGLTCLLAAAVLARLPHPNADAEPEDAKQLDAPATPPPSAPASHDPDAMLRRLRELGELHREGLLTDEEFAAAKQALIPGLARPSDR